MSLHIIIDGYNLIRQSNWLRNLDQQDIQLGREALIDALSEYKREKHHRISVVFDGTDAPSFSQRRDREKGIDIEFSRAGESADAVIKRMAAREREKALVVSSDRDIVNFAASKGAAVISAPLFDEKITRSAHGHINEIDSDDVGGWTPSTKKKGPRRRHSKRERKNRLKTRKL